MKDFNELKSYIILNEFFEQEIKRFKNWIPNNHTIGKLNTDEFPAYALFVNRHKNNDFIICIGYTYDYLIFLSYTQNLNVQLTLADKAHYTFYGKRLKIRFQAGDTTFKLITSAEKQKELMNIILTKKTEKMKNEND